MTSDTRFKTVFVGAGIDPSFTATGVALISVGKCGTFNVVAETFGSKNTYTKLGPSGRAKGAGLRINNLTSDVRDWLYDNTPPDTYPHLAIEGLSFGSVSRDAFDRAGLWWSLYRVPSETVVVVPPLSRIKYAVGATQRGDKTARSKQAVKTAIEKRLGVVFADDNQADAAVLATMCVDRFMPGIIHGLPDHASTLLEAAWRDA